MLCRVQPIFIKNKGRHNLQHGNTGNWWFTNGVTTLALHLPVMLALKESPDSKNYNVNVRLMRTRMKDITLWRDENLSKNLVTKRINTLRA